MTFTIARSHHEYFAFLKSKGLPRSTKEYVFFSDPTHLRGLSNVSILCLEGYEKSAVYNHERIGFFKRLNNIRFVDQTGKSVE